MKTSVITIYIYGVLGGLAENEETYDKRWGREEIRGIEEIESGRDQR